MGTEEEEAEGQEKEVVRQERSHEVKPGKTKEGWGGRGRWRT